MFYIFYFENPLEENENDELSELYVTVCLESAKFKNKTMFILYTAKIKKLFVE